MSLEERNSKRNRELENFANFGSRICEDLVYKVFDTRLVESVPDHFGQGSRYLGR